MGDIADMIQNGDLCQECGVFIDDGMACGYPRYCEECGGDPDVNLAAKSDDRRGR